MFEQCTTYEELTKQWRTVARQLHPDKGGNNDAFCRAYTHYRRAKTRIKQTDEARKQREHQLQIIGGIGAVLTKIAKGEDWINDAIALVPKQYSAQAATLSKVLHEMTKN